MSEFSRYDRYPADILADTGHLSLAEYGAYNRLLDTMWMEDGWLPNNVAALGRIAKAPNRSWWRIWPGLKGFFTVSEDGKWITQKRLMKELEKARKRKARDDTDTAKMAHAKMAGSDCQIGTVEKNDHAKMPKTTSAKSLIHARARVPLPKKEVNNFFISISTPAWRAWQQVKATPVTFSPEHHANGWWFPSEWPPGAEPQEQDVA